MTNSCRDELKVITIIKFFGHLIWPRKNTLLQVNVFLGLVTTIVGCVVNVFVPIYSKKIVDSLTLTTTTFENASNSHAKSVAEGFLNKNPGPWEYILIFVGLKMIQGIGSLSLLNCIQVLLWIKVEQFARKQIQISFFEHIHSLSPRWHLNTKTGDILGALERGTNSINSILEHVLYSLLPTVADIAIAVTYLSLYFSPWFGAFIFVQIITYLFVTIACTEWQSKFQRTLNDADDEQRNQALESLLNFETVRFFGNESYEKEKFLKTVLKVQKTQWRANVSIIFMKIIQTLVMSSGLLLGSLVVVWMICKGDKYGLSTGDYILFISYLGQLYGPLDYLGTYYRELRSSIIDLEYIFEIFQEKQEISDSDWSHDLSNPRGQIEFKNVTFCYEYGREILKNVSFVIPEGHVVAIVGQSGSGKTTILRLLLRFYDVTSGEILIDGEDIRDLKFKSLRRAIGIVPQDTSLFNETLKYNIMYSNEDAGYGEMVMASEHAHILEKISNFPEGYNTKVGERGLKLSGGEKQRIAIARTFLQDPAILLLDEATSALDTHTEKEIQASFMKLCKNRTSLIITHKLSTVMHADKIIVIKNGKIIEEGTHQELVLRPDEYANLWEEQTNNKHLTKLHRINRTR